MLLTCVPWRHLGGGPGGERRFTGMDVQAHLCWSEGVRGRPAAIGRAGPHDCRGPAGVRADAHPEATTNTQAIVRLRVPHAGQVPTSGFLPRSCSLPAPAGGAGADRQRLRTSPLCTRALAAARIKTGKVDTPSWPSSWPPASCPPCGGYPRSSRRGSGVRWHGGPSSSAGARG